MKVLVKSIKNVENKFDHCAEKFSSHHPCIAFAAMFIGMPFFILGGVAAATTAIAFPLALLFGWM